LKLIEIDALMLPERIVFGDGDGAPEIRRDVIEAGPSLRAPRRLTFRARFLRAQIHERGRQRIRRLQRSDVGEREIRIREKCQADARNACDDLEPVHPAITILSRSPTRGCSLTGWPFMIASVVALTTPFPWCSAIPCHVSPSRAV